MMDPVRADIDQIHILALAKLLPGILGAAEAGRFGEAGIGHDLCAAGDILFEDIAQGGDPRPGDVDKAFGNIASAHAQTGIDRIATQPEDVRRPGGTGGNGSGEGKCCLLLTGKDGQQHPGNQEKFGCFHMNSVTCETKITIILLYSHNQSNSL